jgi:hypothetical protein
LSFEKVFGLNHGIRKSNATPSTEGLLNFTSASSLPSLPKSKTRLALSGVCSNASPSVLCVAFAFANKSVYAQRLPFTLRRFVFHLKSRNHPRNLLISLKSSHFK